MALNIKVTASYMERFLRLLHVVVKKNKNRLLHTFKEREIMADLTVSYLGLKLKNPSSRAPVI